MVDEPVSYVATITNNGPFDASAVTARITLPGAARRLSTLPSQGSCLLSGNVLTCDLGTVASGSTATVSFAIAFDSTGSHRLTATVIVGDTAVDSAAPNDSALLDVAISRPTPDPTTRPASPGIGLLPDTSTPLGWVVSLALFALVPVAGTLFVAMISRARSPTRR
jgi:hypothetical protein